MDRTPAQPRRAPAIFSATLELLAQQGYDALTMEAIAVRAGVNKTTIYRTWATKDEVLAAALRRAPELALRIPDTGSLRGDLLALAEQLLRLLATPATQRVIGAVLAAGPDRPATATAAREFFADRMAREGIIFERSVQRGELDPATDPELIMDLLAGSLWFEVLLRDRRVDPARLEAIVDTILSGATARGR